MKRYPVQPRANVVLCDEIGMRAWTELLAESRERRNRPRFVALLERRLMSWHRFPLGERLIPWSGDARRLVFDLSRRQGMLGVTGEAFEPFQYRR